jgi:hypothetical protein
MFKKAFEMTNTVVSKLNEATQALKQKGFRNVNDEPLNVVAMLRQYGDLNLGGSEKR